MKARIVTTENHRAGTFTVEAYCAGYRERFPSVMDAQKWADLMRKTAPHESDLEITLREIILTALREIKSETVYSY